MKCIYQTIFYTLELYGFKLSSVCNAEERLWRKTQTIWLHLDVFAAVVPWAAVAVYELLEWTSGAWTHRDRGAIKEHIYETNFNVSQCVITMCCPELSDDMLTPRGAQTPSFSPNTARSKQTNQFWKMNSCCVNMCKQLEKSSCTSSANPVCVSCIFFFNLCYDDAESVIKTFIKLM